MSETVLENLYDLWVYEKEQHCVHVHIACLFMCPEFHLIHIIRKLVVCKIVRLIRDTSV